MPTSLLLPLKFLDWVGIIRVLYSYKEAKLVEATNFTPIDRGEKSIHQCYVAASHFFPRWIGVSQRTRIVTSRRRGEDGAICGQSGITTVEVW